MEDYKVQYFKEQEQKMQQKKDQEAQAHLEMMLVKKKEEQEKMKYISAATNTNDIWYTNQFKQPQWRDYLNETQYNKKHNETEFDKSDDYNPDVHEQRYNMKKTRINEYSNARHNNRVFINPRFTSC